MKWEKLFTTQIVERGYEYYCEGMVDSFEVTVDGIHGLVSPSSRIEPKTLINFEPVLTSFAQ